MSVSIYLKYYVIFFLNTEFTLWGHLTGLCIEHVFPFTTELYLTGIGRIVMEYLLNREKCAIELHWVPSDNFSKMSVLGLQTLT